jgi:hypothetical protein
MTLPFAGTPSAGTNQVDTLTLDATGGTFKLKVGGFTTAAITWSGTNGTLLGNINTAVRALPNVGGTAVTATAGTLTAGVGTVLLTMTGVLAHKSLVGFFTVAKNSLTGTATCTIDSPSTTPGVDASFRGVVGKGGLVIDTTNGLLYINTGTDANSPTWTKVGTQT